LPDNFTNRRLSRKQREHAFRVNLVLDAARDVFMEKPFANARVEEIAERAELSVGTLYNLFESKEQIYKCVVSRQQDNFFDDLHSKLDTVSEPREAVHTMVRAYFDLFQANLKHWKFHVYATAGLSSDVRNELFAEVQETARGFLERLAAICEQGVAAGVFRGDLRPDLMAIALHSVPHSFLGYIFEQDTDDLVGLVPAALDAVDRIAGVKPK
jgi:AcrR family transcriptional regulator